MLNPLAAFLILLATHWIADFVFQTHWQASNKSKNWRALLRHVVVYTMTIGFVSIFLFMGDNSLAWQGFYFTNGVLHFATDFCTSRWSAKLYAKQDWHNFFVVIGLDQLIHQVTLAATMWWFFYH